MSVMTVRHPRRFVRHPRRFVRHPRLDRGSPGEADSPILTCFDTIHACDAAAVVDFMFLHVDACGLALLAAETAVAAFVCVDHRSKETESREEAEE